MEDDYVTIPGLSGCYLPGSATPNDLAGMAAWKIREQVLLVQMSAAIREAWTAAPELTLAQAIERARAALPDVAAELRTLGGES